MSDVGPTPILERERQDVDALIADLYLERLLETGGRPALGAHGDDGLDDELRDSAAALRRALVRVHPSFRFEERLAARLRAVAASGDASGVAGQVLAFPRAAPTADAGQALRPSTARPRPWLLGGALASAALSVAGVLIVAWRAARDRRREPALTLPLGTLERPA